VNLDKQDRYADSLFAYLDSSGFWQKNMNLGPGFNEFNPDPENFEKEK
jgi:hypothetical protein